MRPKLIFEEKLKPFIESGKLKIRNNRSIEIVEYMDKSEWRKINRLLKRYGYKYHGGIRKGWFLYSYNLPPIIEPNHWELIGRETLKHGAQYTISERFSFIKNGDYTWIVPASGNPDAIYYHDPKHECGFGGATLTFVGVDGAERKFKGVWHSNPHSLFKRTGIDLRKKRACPFNYENPEEECPFYESGVSANYVCKKKLHPFDDPCGEECVRLR